MSADDLGLFLRHGHVLRVSAVARITNSSEYAHVESSISSRCAFFIAASSSATKAAAASSSAARQLAAGGGAETKPRTATGVHRLSLKPSSVLSSARRAAPRRERSRRRRARRPAARRTACSAARRDERVHLVDGEREVAQRVAVVGALGERKHTDSVEPPPRRAGRASRRARTRRRRRLPSAGSTPAHRRHRRGERVVRLPRHGEAALPEPAPPRASFRRGSRSERA